jgi:antitoxin PrlF
MTAAWRIRMITSRITSKAQTTIPQAVRKALGVRKGDELAYRIERGRVIVTKAVRNPAEDPFATFGEWASDNDQRAYGKL